ncbi:helix-hairpin-helix domain-containing protein [Robertmurraya sp. FSL W8-0741]|uniref:helix-hairpin-helix domain-containing protein n=1 Tax=Robertmurraya TaxID=2837507 RepID=UPI000BA7A2DB|nr:helix-hairpin-helix domain-containing protein [Robertmurraya siralis]PAE21885.1 hypothetical protein CHH80_04130 [Bacillus sp. 7504-2]
MIEWIKEQKKYLAIVVVLAGLFSYYLFSSGASNDNERVEESWGSSAEPLQEELSDIEEQEDHDILVDVKGAVRRPGVYRASAGDRIKDVIESAGGITEDANPDATNFAMRVTDEMVVYVPKIGEEEAIGEGSLMDGGTDSANQKININKATAPELETLPGIGPAKAEAIIEYRESNGPFKAIEDIMSISGFGEKTFEKLKESIVVK